MNRRDPDSPVRILKQRMGDLSIEFSVPLGATGARNRDLSVVPSVQAAKGSKPNASVLVSQNGRNEIRQTLFRSSGGGGKVAKAVKAVDGGYPNIAFMILEDSMNGIAREAVRLPKKVRPSVVHMEKTLVKRSDP